MPPIGAVLVICRFRRRALPRIRGGADRLGRDLVGRRIRGARAQPRGRRLAGGGRLVVVAGH